LAAFGHWRDILPAEPSAAPRWFLAPPLAMGWFRSASRGSEEPIHWIGLASLLARITGPAAWQDHEEELGYFPA